MRTRLLTLLVTVLALAVGGVALLQAYRALTSEAPPAVAADDGLNDGFATPLIDEVSLTASSLSLSGTAEPGSTVLLRDETGRRIRQLAVSEAGAWFIDLPIGAAPLSITLDSFIGIDDGETVEVRGDETLLYVPAPGAEDGIAQRPLVSIAVPGGPTRIIQTPFGAPLRSGSLSLISVDYDEAGGTILAGRSEEPGVLHLLSSGRVIGEAGVGPDGRWFFIATDTATDGEKAFEIELWAAGDSPTDRLSVAFQTLPEGETLRQDVGVWQVRRRLPGGGTQVSAVFATPLPRLTGEDEG